MASSLSRAMKLFGTEEPVPETPLLRAGPLECSPRRRQPAPHQAARASRRSGRSATSSATATGAPTTPRSPTCRSSRTRAAFGSATTRSAATRSRPSPTRARIAGRRRGQSLASRPRARRSATSSPTAPASSCCTRVEGVSGAPVEVERVDGSVEHSRFPELIDPTCPFMDIRALTHEPLPGVRVACRMEGDAFEMEDQRNWTGRLLQDLCPPAGAALALHDRARARS